MTEQEFNFEVAELKIALMCAVDYLKTYGDHLDTCKSKQNRNVVECSCGYSLALMKLRLKLKELDIAEEV